MPRAWPLSDDAGYTLIEALIVLTIISIATALATPRLTLLDGKRVQLDTAGVLADVRTLRDDALLSGVKTEIHTTSQGYALAPANITRRLRSGGALTIVASELCECAQNPQIAFFPDGSSTGGAIKMEAGGNHVSITIDPMTAHARLNQ